MKINKLLVVVFLFVSLNLHLMSCSSGDLHSYREMIDRGEFAKAQQDIERILNEDNSLTDEQKFDLSFEIERMRRIRKDFTKNEKDVVEYIKKYIPDVTEAELREWEKEKSLEYMMIDGEKKYFNRAARNLFRVNKGCRQIWQSYHAERNISTTIDQMDYESHNSRIIDKVVSTGEKYVLPVRMRITYTISVKAGAVPGGEIIRCWIPYPREIPERQTDIQLLKTDPTDYHIADNDYLQRTIYFEKLSGDGEETVFSISYEYTDKGSYVPVNPDKVTAVKRGGDLQNFLKEEPPHIVFTEDFINISKEILGDETNPYRKAQILFKWVNDNTPWASAREYSSIRSLSQYGYDNKHGDCGIQSMMFITLCRLNGIPARWQSGWNFKPPDDTMHDWGMIYFEPYGWMPMDAYYGPLETDREDLNWFYLSGMDSYRLVFNDDYACSFSPRKQHYRSETLDSQRGEVEWEGGNLYFDQWRWDMDWEIISSSD